jgi:hypothetical protein
VNSPKLPEMFVKVSQEVLLVVGLDNSSQSEARAAIWEFDFTWSSNNTFSP